MISKPPDLMVFLKNHSFLNGLLLLIYLSITILPHSVIGGWIMEGLFKNVERPQLNLIGLAIGLFILILFLLTQIHQLVQFPPKERKTIIFYLISTLLLMGVSYNLLIIVNTELVHFIQYALLACIVYPLVNRYWHTLIWCTLLGALDEAYQYFYLTSGRPNYFDFNDVVLDLLGAALGLLFLRVHQIPESIPFKRLHLKSPWMVLGFLFVGSIILWMTGELTWYPMEGSKDSPCIVLMKEVPDSFWSSDPWGILHIMKPTEGLIVVALLCLFYKKI